METNSAEGQLVRDRPLAFIHTFIIKINHEADVFMDMVLCLKNFSIILEYLVERK